jgi:hypothetical protein
VGLDTTTGTIQPTPAPGGNVFVAELQGPCAPVSNVTQTADRCTSSLGSSAARARRDRNSGYAAAVAHLSLLFHGLSGSASRKKQLSGPMFRQFRNNIISKFYR